MGSKVNLGSGVTPNNPAGFVTCRFICLFVCLFLYPARRRGRVLYFILLTLSQPQGSSSSLSSSFFFLLLLLLSGATCQYLRHATFNIDQTWPKWPVPWPLLSIQTMMGSKVTMGSLGSKRSISPKLLFLYRLHGMVMWLMHIHQLDTLYKSYQWPLKNYPGSFGVTGVKRSFSPKLLFLLQITWYGHVTHAYSSARYPLQKLSL